MGSQLPSYPLLHWKADLRPKHRSSTLQATPSSILHLDDVIELPRSIEGGLLRTVDAEGAPPPFPWDGLNPHAFLTRWGLRAEVEVVGAVRVRLWLVQEGTVSL